MRTKTIISAIAVTLFAFTASAQQQMPFRDPSLSIDERVNDLLSRLTLEEKAGMMNYESAAVERLGIPAYNWWNEGLHGVARTEVHMTSFPQATGMAASFDTELLQKVGDCVSTEGRALFNEDMKNGTTGKIYRGLTYWSPNINIFRDPRWGRGQETYGEDPYLTGKLAVAFIKGIQGDDPFYYKAAACVKHVAVHSGPELTRHTFDARPSSYDLWDTYLPAFRTSIREGKVAGVMCAYNRINGVPCCGNDALTRDIVRNQLGFDGYLVSDCWAISDFFKTHMTHPDEPTAASDALLAGTDLECGVSYKKLVAAVKMGMISEKNINVSLAKDLKILFKLGFFDPQEKVPYSKIGKEVIECDEHKQVALKASRESIVLLKNNGILPLNSKKIKKIALVGPNSDNSEVQLGNYNGEPTEVITPLKSLEKRFGGQIAIDYIKGCNWLNKPDSMPSFQDVAKRAGKADVIIFVGGISPRLEGEQGDGVDKEEGFLAGDRTLIELPRIQDELLKVLEKTGRPIILVNMSGSAVSQPWGENNAAAIIQAWYGGQAGGDAITDVIFGDYNPAGRLPVTIYRSTSDLPDFSDYSMQNRTYRYFRGDVQYPFGFGLSYTTFAYSNASETLECNTGEKVTVKGSVQNTGDMDGDEVVQLYVKHEGDSQDIKPLCAIKGFKRIFIKKGETAQYEFTLTPEDLGLVDSFGNLVEKAGDVTIFVGGGQPGKANGVFSVLKAKGDAFGIQ